jgi:hypothetical protein
MAAASEKIDVRPILAASGGAPWQSAVGVRDRFAEAIRTTLAREGVRALVLVSEDGNYPPWVRMESWLPSEGTDGGGSRRAELQVVIDAKPYHEHRLTYSAKLTRGDKTLSFSEWPDFSAADLHEWVRYGLGRGPKPSNYRPLKDALAAAALSFIPFVHGPHHNAVEKAFRSSFTLAQGLGWGSVVLLFLAGQSAAAESDASLGIALFLAFLAIAGFVAAGAISAGRAHLVVVPARPESAAPPNSLALVDSWHGIVAGVGDLYPQIKERVGAQFDGADRFGIACRWDTSTYRTPNGYDQRERLIVTKGQGVVHVHVHPFGDDVFVGWQAYLNWAKWAETAPVSAKVEDSNVVEFRDLRPGGYVPNQFDLIDLNSLSEFVHRRLERVVKQILKERDIDQEIDFEIIRGDRDRALDRKRHEFKEGRPGLGGAWGRIARAAAAWQPRSESEAVRSAAAGPEPSRSGTLGWITRPIIAMPLLAAILFLVLAYTDFMNGMVLDLGAFYLFYGFNGVIALVVGFGLWRYLQKPAIVAILAIALVFAALFVMAWAHANLVQPFSFPPPVSYFLDFALSGVGIVLAIAPFERYFRRIGPLLLFGIVSGLLGIAAIMTLRTFGLTAFNLVAALPLALIGYWFERAAEAQE